VEPKNQSQPIQTKLEEITLNAQQYLSNFAERDNFDSVLETAFAIPQAPLLAYSLRNGDFLDRLDLEILPSSELEGALGAYASANDTVYLSRSLLTQGTVEQATDVLLEEVGHAIDDFVNDTDSPGDEGDIFASLVQGNELRDRDLASLREEDDTATLEIGGEQVVVEQAEFTVTNTNDSGEGSLRSAIGQANSNEGADTIAFDSSLSGETIGLTSGQLEITDPLTIEGLGAQELTIDAQENSRVFKIDDGDINNDLSVTIDSLTIQGGSTSDSGGGIYNSESLTLLSSTVSGNTASNNNSFGDSGGGIDSRGPLTIRRGTISNNSAGNVGGGISSITGSVEIVDTSIEGNKSQTSGGGIQVASVVGFNISNSTISNNKSNRGGGISTSEASANIKNSTISGNSATTGGGVFNYYYGTLALLNSTIYNNSADSAAGIYNSSYDYEFSELSSSVTLTNSIISNENGESNIVNEDKLETTGTNLINGNNVPQTIADRNNILNQDPNLGELKNNGGLTETHALKSGSPAIDAGDNSEIPPDTQDLDNDGDTSEPLPFDQRGEGFDRVVNGTVDLGAVEVQQDTSGEPSDLVKTVSLDGQIGNFNPSNGTFNQIGNSSLTLTDVAIDNNGNVFAITFGELYRFNEDTGFSKVGNLNPSNFNGLVFAKDTLIGTVNESSKVYKINSSTSKTSVIGNIDSGTSSGDLAFNPSNNELFVTTEGKQTDVRIQV